MAIGTSLGQWFPDRFSHVTHKYQTQDRNDINPDIDPDLQTGDKMELSTKDFMGNMASEPDPHNEIPIAQKYFDSSDPYQTPLGNFSTNSIRTKGIVDEFGAFARTFRNAKKVTGQDASTTGVITPEPDLSQSK